LPRDGQRQREAEAGAAKWRSARSPVQDIVRLENGKVAEHWDVIQDEVKKEASRSGLPMFGDKVPA
jgi:predicted SnoaL-like aldol condensation-catalyzing enzyme